MKIAAFVYQGNDYVGMVSDDLQTIQPFKLPPECTHYGAQIILDLAADEVPLPPLAAPMALSDVVLRAPLPHPRRNVFCVGKNYLDHVKEVSKSGLGSASIGAGVPEYPIIFTKVPESVIAHNEQIQSHSKITQQLDYEAELAIIIGKQGRGISVENAAEYIWGYTIINDVSARDLQKRHAQWHIAKSLDSFCPMGPWMVSKDEFNATDTTIKCWVNDELRQDSSTSQLIFNFGEIIAALSAGITLYPGDIIATGTPSGVGMGFSPPKFLNPGDKVKITIAGIGTLENTVSTEI